MHTYQHLYYDYTTPKDKKYKTIYLAMGCFWRREALFWQQKGVVYTEVGYAECNVLSPSCEDTFRNVSHREVVRITYDPTLISLDALLTLFWHNHTVDIRDDFPVPTLYQSTIYTTNKEDYKFAVSHKAAHKQYREKNGNHYPISTCIKAISNYVRAKDSHQQYLLKNEDR
jgi:peptide-methionine (S)-S-oxide reductase